MTLPDPGQVIADRYEVINALGHGGGGTVYRAQQLGVAREVALKVLPPERMGDMDALRRFEREARLVSRLRHPNTVTVYEFDRTPDGMVYIAMELVQGLTLTKVLRENMQLEPERVVRILRQILKSLAEAHSIGIVHRDLKPENIMLCDMHGERDFVKVLDFGVATVLADSRDQQAGHHEDVTMTMDAVGTPQYMAPEQLRSEAITAASDLYSLGSLAFEMLAGYNPFSGETINDTIIKHIFEPVPPLPAFVQDYPKLVNLINQLLCKDPTERPQSAEDVLRTLKNWKTTARPRVGRVSMKSLNVDVGTPSPETAPSRPQITIEAEPPTDVSEIVPEAAATHQDDSQDPPSGSPSLDNIALPPPSEEQSRFANATEGVPDNAASGGSSARIGIIIAAVIVLAIIVAAIVLSR